jgi:hypothetical protein
MSGVTVKNDVYGEVEIMKTIPQIVLEEYLRMKKDLDKMHKSILASLDRGAKVEEGDNTAETVDGADKKTEKAARAKVIELGGKEAWDEVLEKAERKPFHRLTVYNKPEAEAKKKERAAKDKAKRAAVKAAKAAKKATK